MIDLSYGPDMKPILFYPATADSDRKVFAAYTMCVQRNFQEAIPLLNAILALNPRHHEVRHMLAWATISMGDGSAAIREMATAIADCPEPLALRANLGLMLLSLGRLDEAVESLKAACEIDPENVDFNTKLAAALLMAARAEEALSTVQRSLQMQPSDIQAQETEQAIRQSMLTPQQRELHCKTSSAQSVRERFAGEYSVTISARMKQGHVSSMLRDLFGSVPLERIDSIFGFHARCRLYGGRAFREPELDDADLQWMYANKIGYRIPLTNMLVTEDDYRQSMSFLARHHREGNSVIVVKDHLAQWIRRDFPLYRIEASVIRGTDTAEKLLKALEIFDTIVPLPEAFNTNYELLRSFPQEVKDRIRLFLNSGCAYHCPRRICYLSFSRMNRQEPNAKFECSQKRLSYHFTQGMSDFPMQRFLELGYHRFKLLRARNVGGATGL